MEQLLVLLVLILIPLANFLLERLRRRQEPSSGRGQRSADVGMRRQAPPPLPYEPPEWERAPRAAQHEVAPRAERRHDVVRFFRNRNEMRRAIIAMTILGPCRANDPPD